MASDVGVFTLAPLPLVNEPLPLLSHFGPKRFEAGIGSQASRRAREDVMRLAKMLMIPNKATSKQMD